MGNSNRGRDFLFSDDCGFINGEDGESYRYSDGSGYYHGSDGSEGYIYSDGSGCFHGTDGSEGYIYSDGSAYYHGSDGTDAYKSSDGSGYYHGSDGSEGYKYSDGSGYYNGSDGSSSRYDPYNEEEDDNDDADLSLGATLAELTLGLGAVAFAKYTAEARREEERRLEAARIAEEKRRDRQAKRQKNRKTRNKRIKALLFNRKNIEFEYSTNELVGAVVEGVVDDLKEAGFNNYTTVPIKDIYMGSSNFVGEVEQVTVNGQSLVEAGTMVPYDAEIVITYHTKREFAFPYSLRSMVKRNYEELTQELLEIGFTEVYTFPLGDLKTGWIKKENSVHQVVIAGVESIKKDIKLDYDVKITIQYHSFANR